MNSKGGHRFGQFLIQKNLSRTEMTFSFYAFAQTNLEGDYLPQCFRCTSDKPGSLLLLVFSEIQPSLFTPVSSSLPVVMLLCFNSQSALDLKSDWPELLPSSVMRKREELWGRDWSCL